MMEDAKSSRSIFLPMGIALGLLSGAFTFKAGGAQWMWQSEPAIGALFALVGVSFLVVHFVRRHHRSRH
ncbi:hypothetical protein ACNPM4_06555 [Microbacterium sp. AGC62]